MIAWETTSSGRLTDPLSGTFAASLTGVVTADRPVRIDAVSFDYSIPGFDCEVDGFDLDFDEESPEFSNQDRFTFKGLCFGAPHRLAIEATDRFGSRTMKIYSVSTAAPRIVLQARLEADLATAMTLRGSSGRCSFLDFGPLTGLRLSEYNTPTVEFLGDEEDLTGWKTDPRRNYRICDGSIPGIPPFPGVWDVAVSAQSSLEIATNVAHGRYHHANNDVNCDVYSAETREIVNDVRVGGVVTLIELFEGVEIVAGPERGRVKLILTARWARWRHGLRSRSQQPEMQFRTSTTTLSAPGAGSPYTLDPMLAFSPVRRSS